MAYTNREKAELKALSGKKHYAMGSIDKMIKKGASKDKALKKMEHSMQKKHPGAKFDKDFKENA